MIKRPMILLTACLLAGLPGVSGGEYLNSQNITVSLGPSMPPNPFQNRTAADSLASIIDATSASAAEFHTQTTHVWVSGGPLEVVFDLQQEYDLTTLHFWNYYGETYDVDNIDLRFYDASNTLIGTQLNIAPSLGGPGSNDATPILAEDIALSAPSGVRFINAYLTGSNGQVDFNNIGFTGTASAIPEPASFGLALVGAGGVGLIGYLRRRGQRPDA